MISHPILSLLISLALAVVTGLLATKDDYPEIAKRMSIKRVLRKNGLLGRRDK